MPFTYFGGKKGLARYYPPPAYGTIVEPFAGSAGYSLHWATAGHRVILIERDPAIVALWRRLQAPDAAERIASIECPPAGTKIADPLIAFAAGGEAVGGRWNPDADGADTALLFLAQGGGGGGLSAATALADATTTGRQFSVTSRMVRKWPLDQHRILAAIPRIRDWTIVEGSWDALPPEIDGLRATWFVDPPYWVPDDAAGTRGDGYRFGASQIDFEKLGDWCQSRRGQVIVCEQDGATWLPFRPLRRWTTATGGESDRLEVVWSRTPSVSRPASPTAARRAAAARTARNARLRRPSS